MRGVLLHRDARGEEGGCSVSVFLRSHVVILVFDEGRLIVLQLNIVIPNLFSTDTLLTGLICIEGGSSENIGVCTFPRSLLSWYLEYPRHNKRRLLTGLRVLLESLKLTVVQLL